MYLNKVYYNQGHLLMHILSNLYYSSDVIVLHHGPGV